MICKYIEKPKVCLAVQFNGHNFDEISNFVGKNGKVIWDTAESKVKLEIFNGIDYFCSVKKRDFVLKENGKIKAMSRDTFLDLYEITA